METTQYVSNEATAWTEAAMATGALAWLQQEVTPERPALLNELLELYLQDSCRLVTMLLASADKQPASAFAPEEGAVAPFTYAAASLREVSALVGALHLSELCRALEQASRQPLLAAEIQTHIAAIGHEHDRVQMAIGHALASQQPAGTIRKVLS
jgi:HPt (histidine-containing phosphotransfer) domain-containing protein